MRTSALEWLPRAGRESIRTFPSWEKLASCALVALAIYLAIHAGERALRGDVSDFRAYYTAASEMRAGRDPYAPADRPYLYPPLLAFLCMPLTSFDMPSAAAIYLVVLIGAVMLTLKIAPATMLQRFNANLSTTTASQATLLLILLMIDRLKSDLQMFQVNTIMLLLFTLGLHCLDKRPTLSGAALGLALNIKGQTILMLPYLLLRRRWSAAGSMAVMAVAFALLPATFTGWNANLGNLRELLGGLRTLTGAQGDTEAPTHLVDVTAGFSVSALSGMARMLQHAGHSEWLWPAAGGLIAVVLAFVVCAYRRAGVPLLHWPSTAAQEAQPWRSRIAVEWSGLIMLTLIFSPQTNSRHFVLMLLPMAMALAAILSLMPRGPRIMMLAGLVICYAALVLPPGSHRIQWLYMLRANWFYLGGPSWVLLGATSLFLLGGLGDPRPSAQSSANYTPQNVQAP